MGEPQTHGIDVRDLCYEAVWMLPSPIMVMENNTIVYVNDATVRLLGHDSAWDLIGGGPETVLHPDMLAIAFTRREAAENAHHQLADAPTKLVRKDGSPVTTYATYCGIEVDGSRLFAVQLHPDSAPLPTHYAAPPAIGVLSRELGWQLLENHRYPAAIATTETMVFVNRTTRDQAGLTHREQVEGHPLGEFIHPDSLGPALERTRLAVATHGHTRRVTNKLSLPDGREVRVTINGYPLGPNGAWRLVVATSPKLGG